MRTLHLNARKAALVLSTAATITSTGLTVQQTTAATGNGQQIKFCSAKNAVSADIKGTNHDSVVIQKSAPFETLSRDSGGCYLLSGWWWKGDIAINWTYGQEGKARSTCAVLAVSDTDVTTCSDTETTPAPKPDTTLTHVPDMP